MDFNYYCLWIDANDIYSIPVLFGIPVSYNLMSKGRAIKYYQVYDSSDIC